MPVDTGANVPRTLLVGPSIQGPVSGKVAGSAIAMNPSGGPAISSSGGGHRAYPSVGGLPLGGLPMLFSSEELSRDL